MELERKIRTRLKFKAVRAVRSESTLELRSIDSRRPICLFSRNNPKVQGGATGFVTKFSLPRAQVAYITLSHLEHLNSRIYLLLSVERLSRARTRARETRYRLLQCMTWPVTFRNLVQVMECVIKARVFYRESIHTHSDVIEILFRSAITGGPPKKIYFALAFPSFGVLCYVRDFLRDSLRHTFVTFE